MKKHFTMCLCLLLAAVFLLSLTACGAKAPEPKPDEEIKAWTRQGYYADENGNMASVTWMDLDSEAGWYVGFFNGEDPVEDSFGGMLPQEGNSLRGVLDSDGPRGGLTVTVTEDGEDGLLLAVEGGETYRLSPLDLPDATIFVTVNTEGWGNIAYAEGEDAPEIDPEYPFQSAQINLADPAVHTFTAWPNEGWHFVKWMKDGEDYSDQATITLELSETMDLLALFAFDEDGQNPVMNFIGPYVCDRARALVEAEGNDVARITIEWGGSAWELARWVITGIFDEDTRTVDYADCVLSTVTYGDDGEVKSEVVEYEDGTGRIVFDDAGSFTWHDDMSERDDMVFEWAWDPGVQVDYGDSALFTQEELEEAVQAIQEKFAGFEGCELHSIRYAGDEAVNPEDLAWLNSLADGAEYTQAAEFLMDFHSPVEDGPFAWEPDAEYTDYQWWLARSEGGGWDVVSWGY